MALGGETNRTTRIRSGLGKRHGDVCEFLAHELRTDVDLSKLTDVHRHTLLQHWRTFANSYETQQFHVRRSGLALLVAYLLHLIQIRHVAIPT
jgi:hypothetical protein